MDEIPENLLFALEKDKGAMLRYAAMDESEKEKITNRVKNAKTQIEIQGILNKI